MRPMVFALICTLFMATALFVMANAQPVFSEIPVEELHTDGLYCNMALSDDGDVAGLFWGWHVYRWTQDDGLSVLAENGDTGFSASIDVSGDGSTILSTIKDADDFSGPAIRRAGDPEWTFLGGIAGEPPLGSEYGTASTINHDGTMATGLGWARNDAGYLRATPFLWSEGSAVSGLPKTNPDVQARGNCISGDGSVVIGWNENDFGNWRPCRWVDGIGPEFFLGETTLGVGQAMSANGNYYVVTIDGNSYRYSEEDGAIPLGISGWPDSRGHGVSNDGVVIGYDGYTALIWTEEGGLQDLSSYLLAAGCTDHIAWQLFWAIDISTDGSTIIGAGRKPNGWAGIWRVELPDPTAVAGTPRPAGRLLGSYPNPFNPQTTIAYDLERTGDVRLSIYDPSGHRITTLVDGQREAGNHTAIWQGRNAQGREVGSGTYLIRLETESGEESRKIQLLR